MNNKINSDNLIYLGLSTVSKALGDYPKGRFQFNKKIIEAIPNKNNTDLVVKNKYIRSLR